MPSYHVSSSGKVVKCASDPCKLHNGTDVQANSAEEATKMLEEQAAKANETQGATGLTTAKSKKKPSKYPQPEFTDEEKDNLKAYSQEHKYDYYLYYSHRLTPPDKKLHMVDAESNPIISRAYGKIHNRHNDGYEEVNISAIYLHPRELQAQASFSKKAIVLHHNDPHKFNRIKESLVSYNTNVMDIENDPNNGTQRVVPMWDASELSNTTMRHMREFLAQNGVNDADQLKKADFEAIKAGKMRTIHDIEVYCNRKKYKK